MIGGTHEAPPSSTDSEAQHPLPAAPSLRPASGASSRPSVAIGHVHALKSRMQHKHDSPSSSPPPRSSSSDSAGAQSVSPSSPQLVTGLSWWYHVIFNFMNSIQPFLYVRYYMTENEIYREFYARIVTPLHLSTLMLSLVIKPARHDRLYHFYLVMQFIPSTFMSEGLLATVAHRKGDVMMLSLALLRIFVVWPICLLVAFRFRIFLNQQLTTPESINKYVTRYVLVTGFSELIPILFLTFQSVRCVSLNTHDPAQCVTTVNAQVFIGAVLTFLLVRTIISSAVPEHMWTAHQITAAAAAKFDMTLPQTLRFFGNGVVATCMSFLVACLGAVVEDRLVADFTIFVGYTSIFIVIAVMLLDAWEIWRAFKAEQRYSWNASGSSSSRDVLRPPPSSPSSPLPAPSLAATETTFEEHRNPIARREAAADGAEGIHKSLIVTEFATIHFVAPVVACWALTAFSAYYAATANADLLAVVRLVLPLATFTFIISFFFRPRSTSVLNTGYLVFHFLALAVASEVLCSVGQIRAGDFRTGFMNGKFGPLKESLVRIFVIWIPFFWLGMRFRKALAGLRDEDLSNVMTKTVLRSGVSAFALILYFEFVSVRCIIESREIQWEFRCANAVICTHYLAIMVVLFFCIQLAFSSFPESEDMHITTRKIVALAQSKMSTLVIAVYGVSGACVLNLFSSMYRTPSSENDVEEFTRNSSKSGVIGVGGLLLLLAGRSFVRFWRLRKGWNGSDDVGRSSEQSLPPIQQVHMFFSVVAVFITGCQPSFSLCYAVTKDIGWMSFSQLLMPFSLLSYVVTFMLQPRRDDSIYYWFMRGHFFSFCLMNSGFIAVGDYRNGDYSAAAVDVLRAAVFVPVYVVGQRYRKIVGSMPDSDLSEYLLVTCFENGINCLLTTLYLITDSIQCISQFSFEECRVTTVTSAYLNSMMVVLMMVRMAMRGVPNQLKTEHSVVTVEQLASFSMIKRQRYHVFALTVSGLCALYLMSTLGLGVKESEANKNRLLTCASILGLIGIVMIVSILLVESYVFWKRSRRSSLSTTSSSSLGTNSECYSDTAASTPSSVRRVAANIRGVSMKDFSAKGSFTELL